MPDEFHGDKTLLTSYETPIFSLLATSSVKLMIFNVIKFFMKPPLRLALVLQKKAPSNGAFPPISPSSSQTTKMWLGPHTSHVVKTEYCPSLSSCELGTKITGHDMLIWIKNIRKIWWLVNRLSKLLTNIQVLIIQRLTSAKKFKNSLGN